MYMKEYGCCPKFKRRDNSTYTFTKGGGAYTCIPKFEHHSIASGGYHSQFIGEFEIV
jgi:hypothetical protein